jgi:hypothetical protein
MGFAYHGNAVAFGARIDRPTPDIIPSQASAVLAPAGGEGMAVVRNFDYKGIISFDEAKSYVAGSFERAHEGEPEDSYNTLATVTIRNLNVGNMFIADSVVARVSSKHTVNKDGVIADEGEITFDGSLIEGVRIAGLRGEVALDAGLFARYPTFTSFMSDFPNDSQFSEKSHVFWGGENVQKALKMRGNVSADEGARIPQACTGVVSCSLFDRLSHRIPTLQELREAGRTSSVYLDGFGVTIREFGTIYFAEVVMKRGQRRLNMLRFNLGCPLCGDGSGGTVEGNGSPTVP